LSVALDAPSRAAPQLVHTHAAAKHTRTSNRLAWPSAALPPLLWVLAPPPCWLAPPCCSSCRGRAKWMLARKPLSDVERLTVNTTTAGRSTLRACTCAAPERKQQQQVRGVRLKQQHTPSRTRQSTRSRTRATARSRVRTLAPSAFSSCVPVDSELWDSFLACAGHDTHQHAQSRRAGSESAAQHA
jgi:hypothetical protein